MKERSLPLIFFFADCRTQTLHNVDHRPLADAVVPLLSISKVPILAVQWQEKKLLPQTRGSHRRSLSPYGRQQQAVDR